MNLQSHFPKASKSFLNANPQLCGQIEAKSDSTGNVERVRGKRGGLSISMSGEPYWSEGKPGRHGMNKTEREYSFLLEAQKRAGEILRYEFEGITLRFAGVRYTADFAVFHRAYIKLIEVKGPFIKGNRERAVERFRHAKTYWGDVFTFELHQRQKGGQWTQLI